jgi:hypothetical protein
MRRELASALNQQSAGGDDQRAARTGERRTESFDSPLVFFSSGSVIREVVDEAGVDHAVGSGCSTSEALEILKRAVMCIGSQRSERLGGLIRASQAEDFVTCLQQLGDDSRTDEACSTCYKNFHKYSFSCRHRKASCVIEKPN